MAHFGTFGYELDLNKLSDEEREKVREQIKFMKEYREVLQFGTFYRLISPFDNSNFASWMVVSEDKKTALVGYYKILNQVNAGYHRVKLCGLNPDLCYSVTGYRENPTTCHYGDELMHVGLLTTDGASGQPDESTEHISRDFDSCIFVLRAQ